LHLPILASAGMQSGNSSHRLAQLAVLYCGMHTGTEARVIFTTFVLFQFFNVLMPAWKSERP